MAQFTIHNVPDEIARALKIRAARHGRSTEAELRAILSEVLRGDSVVWERADTLRARSRKQRTDSAELLREMRDER